MFITSLIFCINIFIELIAVLGNNNEAKIYI